MGYRNYAFICEDCGHHYEDLLWKEYGEDTKQQLECPECGNLNEPVPGCAIASFSIMSRENQTAHLKKRSYDHSNKMFKKNKSFYVDNERKAKKQ